MIKQRKYSMRQLALLRRRHRAMRKRMIMKPSAPLNTRLPIHVHTSIWSAPRMHSPRSFSHPLSPINKEYNEPEERSERKEMNWAQAKRVFPKLRPFADADKDGIYNMFDCRPFNKKKQGEEHEDQLVKNKEIYDFGVSFNKQNREKNNKKNSIQDDAQSLIDDS
jgi:hypothetical protein